jgi:hypothetical protein
MIRNPENKKKLALALLCICATITLFAADRLETLNKPSAIATFESIGITCGYSGDDNSNASCSVKYRKKSSKKWKQGYPLWRDSKRREFRGSVVNLTPGTKYEIKVIPNDPDGMPKNKIFSAKTWSETFPIAKTVYITGDALKNGFRVTKSGTPKGYIRYTTKLGKSKVIDVANKVPSCITVNASYVIISGLTLKGAQQYAINIKSGNDIVIEKCDINNWGDVHKDGWGLNMRCAIYSNNKSLARVIIQRNTIHNPRTDSNNWTEARVGYNRNSKHPAGTQAVGFYNSEGNHVIRYNHVYSDAKHYYNDIFGAGSNGSLRGFPNCDSDIYGNIVENCWDDAIEAEGANKNVRIWGNYIENCFQAIATRSTSVGPIYIWRNVAVIGYRSPNDHKGSGFHKSGYIRKQWGDFGVFDFHNTAVMPQKTINSGAKPYTRGIWGSMVYTTSINNILAVPGFSIRAESGGAKETSHFNNDLCSGKVSESKHKNEKPIIGTPKFTTKFGLNRKTGKGIFILSKSSKGYNKAVNLPNFNDTVPDKKPDVGAHEAGTPPMEFGPKAYLKNKIYIN